MVWPAALRYLRQKRESPTEIVERTRLNQDLKRHGQNPSNELGVHAQEHHEAINRLGPEFERNPKQLSFAANTYWLEMGGVKSGRGGRALFGPVFLIARAGLPAPVFAVNFIIFFPGKQARTQDKRVSTPLRPFPQPMAGPTRCFDVGGPRPAFEGCLLPGSFLFCSCARVEPKCAGRGMWPAPLEVGANRRMGAKTNAATTRRPWSSYTQAPPTKRPFLARAPLRPSFFADPDNRFILLAHWKRAGETTALPPRRGPLPPEPDLEETTKGWTRIPPDHSGLRPGFAE